MSDHAGYWIKSTVQEKCEHRGTEQSTEKCPYCEIAHLRERFDFKGALVDTVANQQARIEKLEAVLDGVENAVGVYFNGAAAQSVKDHYMGELRKAVAAEKDNER